LTKINKLLVFCSQTVSCYFRDC